MYWISVSALAAVAYFYSKGKKCAAAVKGDESSAKAGSVKEESVQQDEAGKDSSGVPEPEDTPVKDEQAEKTDDSNQFLASMAHVSDPLERHARYMDEIDRAYKKRNIEDGMRDLFLEYAQHYVSEFSSLKDAVLKQFGDNPKLVTVFKQLAIVYEESQLYDLAIELCEAAIGYGLEDGTKTGYPGRVARIKKKSANSNR